MKASSKNTDNSGSPILFKNWPSKIRGEKGKKKKPKFEVHVASFDRRLAAKTGQKRDYKLASNRGKVDLLYRTNKIGERVLRPNIKTIPVKKGKVKHVNMVSGFRPEHLDKRPVPSKLPKELELPKRLWQRKRGVRDNLGEPTTIFAPDTRYTFSDTSFPWSTCGRVEVAGSWGSGVMVGPRHVMTASHVVNWGPNNTAGWLKFTPMYLDGDEPFGSAYATTIYWWNKADGSDGINSLESAFDYVICVLDTRLGDITGWMGSREYSSSWNGGAYWAHVGYPGDMASGLRPAFHGGGVMDETSSLSTLGRDSFVIKHKNDVWPGQSGGPYYGWWENQPWPEAVSSQSAQNWGSAGGPNTCGGGRALPELINFARSDHP